MQCQCNKLAIKRLRELLIPLLDYCNKMSFKTYYNVYTMNMKSKHKARKFQIATLLDVEDRFGQYEISLILFEYTFLVDTTEAYSEPAKHLK